MKLAYVYYYANQGGVTSVIKSRIPALHAAGVEVHGIFETDVGGVSDLVAGGLKSVKVKPQLRSDAGLILEEGKFDIITLIDMPELLLPLRAQTNARIVYEIHTPIERVLLRTTAADMDAADVCYVPSRWSRDWVVESIPGNWDRDKVVVMPNIIDREIFRPSKASRLLTINAEAGRTHQKRPTILWVGKIAAYKRWRDAVRILSLVYRKLPSKIVFVTGGEMNERTTEDFLAEKMACGLFGKCDWYHNLSIREMGNVYREAAASDGMLLSTSEAESFCLVVHEAMSCGLPVAAAAAGALPEIFKEQLGELLFHVGDVENADAIIRSVVTKPQRWSHVQQLSLEVQSHFDSEQLGHFYTHSLVETVNEGRNAPVAAE